MACGNMYQFVFFMTPLTLQCMNRYMCRPDEFHWWETDTMNRGGIVRITWKVERENVDR